MILANIQTNVLWDLTAIFTLLSMAYLTFLFILTNNLSLKWTLKGEKKNRIRGILIQMILYEKGIVPTKVKDIIDLKVELWKLLKKKGNRQILSHVLTELNSNIDVEEKPILQRLSKEFDEKILVNYNGNPCQNTSYTTNNSFVETKNDKLTENFEYINNKTVKNENVANKATDFFPFVATLNEAPNVVSKDLQESLQFNDNMGLLKELLNKEDIKINPYSEISEEFVGEKEEDMLLNLDFLPIILEEKENNLKSDIFDIEVDSETIIDPFIKNQISDILKSHVANQKQTNSFFIDGSVVDLGKMQLPPVKFHTEKESKRVKLLYTIARLGDIREIPFLSEMMVLEENESIVNLITEIISKFLSENESVENKYNAIERDGVPLKADNYCAFNRLFNALDIESQLTFLDEIMMMGQGNELLFVESLGQHPIKEIRQKARVVLVSLKNKIKDKKNNQNKLDTSLRKDPTLNSSNTIFTNKKLQDTNNEDYVNSENIESQDTHQTNIDKKTTKEGLNSQDDTKHIHNKNIENLDENSFLEQLKEIMNTIFKR